MRPFEQLVGTDLLKQLEGIVHSVRSGVLVQVLRTNAGYYQLFPV